MDSQWLGFLELFVVLAFFLGLGVIELMLLRRDKRRAKQKKQNGDKTKGGNQ